MGSSCKRGQAGANTLFVTAGGAGYKTMHPPRLKLVWTRTFSFGIGLSSPVPKTTLQIERAEVAMRKLLAWGFAGVLVASLAVANARAGDDDEDTPEKPAPRPFIRWSRYFAGMNASTQPKPEPPKPAAKKKETSKKPAETAKPKPAVDEAAAARVQEEATLMRRLEVCDKLKEIALRTNDNALFRKAEVLDEQARAAYAQRTAMARGGRFETDEKTVEKYLSSAPPLNAPAPESTAHTVSVRDAAGRAELKEGER
jgi:hypothetical protein